MSGGPPHHPHGRQAPPANAAWNHLQVPNFFPSRQPQHAHMSNEHSVLHQPTWHTPTTEPLKAHPHIFSLEQMLSDRQFTRPAPGVDLTLTKNGGQNGELPPATPISLSVRDTNKINSLPPSALDILPSDSIKPLSPGVKSALSPGLEKKKKSVDSILERLNPNLDKEEKSVIVAASSHDENSNSSGVLNVPIREDEVVSPYSNDDSLDSNKSRRKRKPSKTIRVAKEPLESKTDENSERRNSDDETRRKALSESETIDNIAAMVQEGLKTKENNNEKTAISVSVIKTKENLEALSDLSNSSNNVSTTKNSNQFVEVENKLEEMFAGIEDSKADPAEASTSQDVTSTSTEVKKTPKKVKKKQGKIKSLEKKKNNKKKSLKQCKKKLDVVKDVYAYDSGSNASSSKSRGPFIQIKGSRDSPMSVNVINTPTNEDDGERRTHKTKKYHDDSEYRHKVRSKGLHCSTLSHQYDAQTKDASWICAFCKRGPHATELSGPSASAAGDLFGPYYITTNSPEFERRLDDPFDKQFKSKKIARVLVDTGRKKKRKHSFEGEDVYLGMTRTEGGTFEIWAHEDCIVWSAGTYLIGPKIMGLEEAIWTSCNVSCDKCHLQGANICCLKRGCVKSAHVCCARLTNWQLDNETYKTYCPEHRAL